MPRQTMELKGTWRMAPDPGREGFEAGYHSPAHGDRGWHETRVPSSIHSIPGLSGYEGLAWYRITFHVPRDWKGKRVVLRTEAVNNRSTVWVNGHAVGSDPDGFLVSEYTIGDTLEYGSENLLAIAVDGTRHAEDVPGLQRGWKPFPGIIRPVYLTCSSNAYVDDMWAQAEPIDDGTGSLRLSYRLVDSGETTETVTPRITLNGMDGQTHSETVLPHLTLEPGQALSGSLEISVAGIVPWSPDTPVMYGLTMSLTDPDGRTVDEHGIRIGFRRIGTFTGPNRGCGILLNGKPVTLMGFNRHEDTLGMDMCPDYETLASDIRDMKSMGCNFVRLCHYPHDPRELDMYDDAGLLVMEEIPLYWWSGYGEGSGNYPKRMEAARRQLRRLIIRDRNHPCTVIWSVSNENNDEVPGVNEGNQELIRYARQLDPTRLVTRVSDKWTKSTVFDDEDIISVNAYPSWDGRIWKANPVYNPAESGEWWRRELTRLHSRHPDKPILVTEFGYPGVQDTGASPLGEDYQKCVIQAEFKGFSDLHFVAGAAVWCYADHPWPEEPFISYMTTSPFGVVGRDRRKKAGHAVVARMFRERLGIPEPTPWGYGWDSDNPTVDMVWDGVSMPPVPEFPEGYGIRPMRPDEGPLWEDIWRDAEPFLTIGPGLFRAQFGSDAYAITERCMFITDPRGCAVGTVSAWFDSPAKGRIHWVAVRPAHQGKGLAKPAVAHAMRILIERHDGIVLTTSLGRRAAVKSYLDLGFVPSTDSPEGIGAWRAFQESMAHPKLHVWLKRHGKR